MLKTEQETGVTLLTILGLCLTSYGLGYIRGKHDSKSETGSKKDMKKISDLVDRILMYYSLINE